MEQTNIQMKTRVSDWIKKQNSSICYLQDILNIKIQK